MRYEFLSLAAKQRQTNEATVDQPLGKSEVSSSSEQEYKKQVVRPIIIDEKQLPKKESEEDTDVDNDERSFMEQEDTKQSHAFALKESMQHETVSPSCWCSLYQPRNLF